MQGTLRKNANGRWEIVNELGERIELTSGDVVDLFTAGRWMQTRIESRGGVYYAIDGYELFTGRLARYKGR